MGDTDAKLEGLRRTTQNSTDDISLCCKNEVHDTSSNRAEMVVGGGEEERRTADGRRVEEEGVVGAGRWRLKNCIPLFKTVTYTAIVILETLSLVSRVWTKIIYKSHSLKADRTDAAEKKVRMQQESSNVRSLSRIQVQAVPNQIS